jgi:hypothetical protein
MRPRRILRFEHGGEPLLPRQRFVLRVVRHAAVSGGIVSLSLAIGVAGYHWIAGLSWLDAFLNASMILTGMGPVDRLDSAAAKLFASAYALFSGVAFLTMAAVLFAPLVHRMLHRLHLDPESVDSPQRPRRSR